MPLNHHVIAKGFLLILGLSFSIHIARNLYEALSYPPRFLQIDPYDWEPSYSGWYNRSAIITDTTGIHLNASDLILASTSSAWGDDSFHLAMFRPDLCIMNHAALRMNQTDLIGIENLARGVAKIKQEFYNLAPDVFDLSTETLHLFVQGWPIRQYNAYAFSQYGSRRGGDRMPRKLCELFRLMVDDPDYLETGNEDLKRLLAEVAEMI